MSDWFALILIGLGTFALRAVFIVRADRRSARTPTRYLRYVGPAVLAAIATPALIAPAGHISTLETGPALIAAAAAWLLWRRRRSLPLALFTGLGCWWIVLATLPALS